MLEHSSKKISGSKTTKTSKSDKITKEKTITPSPQNARPDPQKNTSPSPQSARPDPQKNTSPSPQSARPDPQKNTPPSPQSTSPPTSQHTTISPQNTSPPASQHTTVSSQNTSSPASQHTTVSPQSTSPPASQHTTVSPQSTSPPASQHTTVSPQSTSPPASQHTTVSLQSTSPPASQHTTPVPQSKHSKTTQVLSAKPINIALQGGGAHGAFAWGVLDRLLEDERISFEGISATSAGAMNAVVCAYGLAKGGRKTARQYLETFWYQISQKSPLKQSFFSWQSPLWEQYFKSPLKQPFFPWQSLWEQYFKSPLKQSVFPWQSLWEQYPHSFMDLFFKNPFDRSSNTISDPLSTSIFRPWFMSFDIMTRLLSPYQFNPLNYNPLKLILEEVVDFDFLCQHNPLQLFICATNVRNGKVKIFRNHELSSDVILASGCLPFLFQTVLINDTPYWDGGFMGNPAIYPLIYHCHSQDVVIVHINPIERDGIPTTAPEILDRLNEISFNSSLMREMRAINFVTHLIEEGKVTDKEMKYLFIHSIEAFEVMCNLSVLSKLYPDWEFLTQLRDIGREKAEQWLINNYDKIGNESTIDIRSWYL